MTTEMRLWCWRSWEYLNRSSQHLHTNLTLTSSTTVKSLLTTWRKITLFSKLSSSLKRYLAEINQKYIYTNKKKNTLILQHDLVIFISIWKILLEVTVSRKIKDMSVYISEVKLYIEINQERVEKGKWYDNYWPIFRAVSSGLDWKARLFLNRFFVFS